MTDTKIQSKFLGNAAPTEKGQQIMNNLADMFRDTRRTNAPSANLKKGMGA